MNPDRWQQVKELLGETLQRAPDERAAFLDAACGGDDSLRREVESLLTSYQTDFMAQPAVGEVAEMLLEENSKLSSGRQIAHYQIIKQLGAGGMGEVFLAEDSRLRRRVALKVLPVSIANDTDHLRRFEREAFAASALNHPNILTIFEFGAEGETHFLASEYVNGETLRDKLRRQDLTLRETVEITLQIASALQAAHEAGIIHRDIKPENVMLREDGYVKVLDFGLAKLLEQNPLDADAETRRQFQTRAGLIMGTVAYMSPEQARGQVLDARTDLWSLGCVLYELLTRRPSFQGDTVTDVLANIIHREPAPLRAQRPDAPAELERIVLKMLRKDKAARYATARDLQADMKQLQMRLVVEAELERTSAPHRGEAKTQILQAATTAEKSTSSTTDSEEGFWVAVLPFKYRGANADLEALAGGLSEEIITGLSRFTYLQVIARSSAGRFSTAEFADVRAVGAELGARYVLEGNLRESGATVRIATQLVETTTGTHLWAETYDRQLNNGEIFAIQDELVPRIVSTVADQHGVLVHSIAEAIRKKDKNQITPSEAVMSVFSFHERVTPENHLVVRDLLEHIVRKFPNAGNCWAMLETLYCDEYMFGFNPEPDSLGRALTAAQRAVETAPTSNLACQALAQAHFFRRDLEAFHPLAERTIMLNRMDGATVAFMGILIACSGEWERGCQVTEQAMRLNPHFPGWYRLAVLFDAYRRSDYRAALAEAEKINLPKYFWTLVMRTASLGQLGELEKAREALRELLAVRPDFTQAAPEEFGRWFDAKLVEQLMGGLHKAGLEVVAKPNFEEPKTQILRTTTIDEIHQTTTNQTVASNPTKKYLAAGLLTLLLAVGGFFGYKYLSPTTTQINSIAVLPFENRGGNADSEYLSDGLAESLIYRLSQLPDLKVSPTSSVFRYKGKETDPQTIAKELGVDSVMTGRITQRGDNLTISVNLVDTRNGKSLWGAQYERKMSELLATQREIASEIANKLQLKLSGAGEQKLTKKYTDNNEAYQLYLKGRYYWNKRTEENLRKAIEQFKAAADLDPNYALAFVGLADCYAVLPFFSGAASLEVLPQAKSYATRALEIDDSLGEAHASLGLIHSLSWNWAEPEKSFKRSIELNPNYATAHHWFGQYLETVGRYDEAEIQYKRAIELEPLALVSYNNLAELYIRKGDLNAAAEQCQRAIELDPNWYYIWFKLAIVYLKQGRNAEAIGAAEKSVELSKRESVPLGFLGYIYTKAGRQTDAIKIVEELKERYQKQQASGIEIAYVYSGLGEKDQAFVWLEKEFQSRNQKLPIWLAVGWFDSLRDDPRYKALLKRMGLPE